MRTECPFTVLADVVVFIEAYDVSEVRDLTLIFSAYFTVYS
jgi:hypothetical protein